MDMRKEIKRCLSVLVQLADEADSQEIKQDIALLQGTMSAPDHITIVSQ